MPGDLYVVSDFESAISKVCRASEIERRLILEAVIRAAGNRGIVKEENPGTRPAVRRRERDSRLLEDCLLYTSPSPRD